MTVSRPTVIVVLLGIAILCGCLSYSTKVHAQDQAELRHWVESCGTR